MERGQAGGGGLERDENIKSCPCPLSSPTVLVYYVSKRKVMGHMQGEEI